ncbi:TetR/AcrR family transcriptional regulator [Catenulispora subtropica]|uniref:TetR/AcrR family transcriptional regulator n=1 Tax=Catenulispora subtropica TaxID=450798 RepID=A0ABN2SQP0_9ACTN
MTSRSAARRRQLTTVAGGLFARDGYPNVTVRDIAAAAGVSGPAIYRHFAGKDAILAELMRAGFDEIDTIGAVALGGLESATAGERLDAVVRAMAAFVVRNPEFGVLWRREFRHLAAADAVELTRRMSAGLVATIGELRRVRPELGAAEARLVVGAALSVLGSISDHRVRLGRRALEDLLAAVAADVLRAQLPEPGGSPPTEPSATPPPATRREELVAHAVRLFQQSGYHRVTMEDVGAAAGIAGPSVYKHFAGKTDLLRAVVRRLRDRLQAALDAPAGPGSADDQLAMRARSYVETVVAERSLVLAFHAEVHNLPRRDRVEIRRLVAAYVQRWTVLVGAALPGRGEAEAGIRVQAAFAVVNDSVRSRRLARQPETVPKLTALMLAVLTPRS